MLSAVAWLPLCAASAAQTQLGDGADKRRDVDDDVPTLAYELASALRRGLLRERAVAHAVGRREVRDVDRQAVGARVGVELEHGAARLAMRRREGSIAAQVSPAPWLPMSSRARETG